MTPSKKFITITLLIFVTSSAFTFLFKKTETIINKARDFTGVKYQLGGTDKNGIDCSGLTQSSYKSINYLLPRVSYMQAEIGQKIDFNKLSVGDLVFFGKPGSQKVCHVGMVTTVNSKTDVLFIHASCSKGVMETNLFGGYWEPRLRTARRPDIPSEDLTKEEKEVLKKEHLSLMVKAEKKQLKHEDAKSEKREERRKKREDKIKKSKELNKTEKEQQLTHIKSERKEEEKEKAMREKRKGKVEEIEQYIDKTKDTIASEMIPEKKADHQIEKSMEQDEVKMEEINDIIASAPRRDRSDWAYRMMDPVSINKFTFDPLPYYSFNKVILEAKSYLGYQYQEEANGDDDHIDNFHLFSHAFENVDILLPTKISQWIAMGTPVSSEPLVGDVLFFGQDKSSPKHVALISRVTENSLTGKRVWILHADPEKGVIEELLSTSKWKNKILLLRRIK